MSLRAKQVHLVISERSIGQVSPSEIVSRDPVRGTITVEAVELPQPPQLPYGQRIVSSPGGMVTVLTDCALPEIET